MSFSPGMEESDIETLYDFELWATRRMFGDKRYQAVVVGAFKEELYDRLTDIKKEKVDDELLSVYSSHDYTLIPLMVALGIELSKCSTSTSRPTVMSAVFYVSMFSSIRKLYCSFEHLFYMLHLYMLRVHR
jgi:hypothetical protein